MSPRFSVLIPTLNEAANIRGTVASAKQALGESAEYIVADAGSSDATVRHALQVGARVVHCARSRGAQLDDALRTAGGDVCVVLHADTLLPDGAAQLIEQALAGANAGAFLLQFENGKLPWLAAAINMRSVVLRSATGDQAMFARRNTLLQTGGIPRVELFEDVRLWQQLKRAGRVTLVRAKVTTSARLWIQHGAWRGILLHWRLRILHAFGMTPRRLAKMYPTSVS
jgi:rSAM/selenodomain-associated transferase 2